MTKKQKKVLIRIIVAAILLVILHFVPLEGIWLGLLYLIPYAVIGYDILRKAVLGIMHGEVFDENFLMAVATVGAMGLGEYSEGVAVMLFYQIGELFQAVAVGKSRQNISALMDIRPDYANIEAEDGSLEQVDPDDVEIGTVIVVRPGEKVPIDGVVVEGTSTLNTSALTGESVPREITVDQDVISGCVNLTGLLKIRTTKEFGESTVSKILDLVENSSMKKSKSENFITKFARYYTPAVCYSALALAILPPVINLIMGNPAAWSTWIIRALTFLVISCPCALVISIPLSFFGGIGAASACGILVKGSNYLEALSETKYVVFDKTGTLTKGVFDVTGIYPGRDFTEDELLEYAAYAESYSNHPISKSLKISYGKELEASNVSDVEEISGHGGGCGSTSRDARPDRRPVPAGERAATRRDNAPSGPRSVAAARRHSGPAGVRKPRPACVRPACGPAARRRHRCGRRFRAVRREQAGPRRRTSPRSSPATAHRRTSRYSRRRTLRQRRNPRHAPLPRRRRARNGKRPARPVRSGGCGVPARRGVRRGRNAVRRPRGG